MSNNRPLLMSRLPETDAAVPHTGRQRRWVTAAVGLGTPAAALLTAAVIGIGTAPAAHADDPITDVLGTLGATLTDFYDGAGSFLGFHLAQGIADFGAGIDNTLFGYLDDAVIGTTDFLTGANHVPWEFATAVPADLSQALTWAGGDLTAASTDFFDAFKEFFSFTPTGLADGLASLAYAFDDGLVVAPQIFGEGLLSVVGL